MKNTLKNLRPASWHMDRYRDATPIGGGKVGALVLGDTAKERIIINDHRLWHRGKAPKLFDVSCTLDQMRKKMDNGDFHGANSLLADALKSNGYSSSLEMPHPLCSIEVDIGERELFTDYSRTLLMDKALCKVSWRERNVFYSRRAFVSRSDNSVCVNFSASRKVDTAKIALATYDTCQKDTKDFLKNCGENIKIFADGQFLIYIGKNEADISYGAVMKVSSDSDIAVKDGCIILSDVSEFTLRLLTFACEDPQSAVMRLKDTLSQSDISFDELLDKSADMHFALYSRAEIDIADSFGTSNEELLLNAYRAKTSLELTEKLWRFARYLFICGTSKDGDPFPLYGLFHGRYSMPWPHNMANENVQLIYQHALCGDLPELVEALTEYYISRMDVFRQNAKMLFGLDGIYIPAGTTPNVSVPNQVVPVIMNWISCAGWLSRQFYDHCLYTSNDELLKNKVLPFMFEAAKFIEGYITIRDHKVLIYPSVSPENTPGNLMTGEFSHLSHPCPCAINATMDIAIIKDLLLDLILASNRLGMYKEYTSKWENIIAMLPKYEKNKDGAIREWQHDSLCDNYYHRHLSHLYPIFPGREYIADVSDPDIIDAFKKAVELRKMGAQTSWSLVHMASLYSRFLESEKAMEMLDAMTKTCLTESLLTISNDIRAMGLTMEDERDASFAPIQLDALMGFAGAVQEMLLFDGGNIIKILPALPKRFKEGSFKGFRSEYFTVSAAWGEKFKAELKAMKDGEVTFVLPKTKKGYTFTIGSDKKTSVTNCRFTAKIKRGDTILIEEKE